jgi:hypothetical protein
MVNRVENFSLTLVFRLGGREARVNILRNEAELLSPSSC